MATTTNYYGLSKPSYNEVADIEVINANMDKIDTQMRNNADGVNFAKGISSDAYDNSRPYAVGDYCIYDNKLYRCTTAIESAEAFNVEKWEQTTVGNEVNQLNSNLTTKLLSGFGSTIVVDGGTFNFLTAYSIGKIIFLYGSYKITKSVGNYVDIFQVSSNYRPKMLTQSLCIRTNDSTSRQLYVDTNGIVRLYPISDATGNYVFNSVYCI